jgi:hypothetical protein
MKAMDPPEPIIRLNRVYSVAVYPNTYLVWLNVATISSKGRHARLLSESGVVLIMFEYTEVNSTLS